MNEYIYVQAVRRVHSRTVPIKWYAGDVREYYRMEYEFTPEPQPSSKDSPLKGEKCHDKNAEQKKRGRNAVQAPSRNSNS